MERNHMYGTEPYVWYNPLKYDFFLNMEFFYSFTIMTFSYHSMHTVKFTSK